MSLKRPEEFEDQEDNKEGDEVEDQEQEENGTLFYYTEVTYSLRL